MFYSNLLKLCGYEDDEIEREKPRIEKAFKIAGISPEDCQRAEVTVKEDFDVELTGVRKLLGIWIKELVDLVLGREEGKPVVYYSFPTIAGYGLTLSWAGGEKMVCVAPEVVLQFVMGQIFHKLNPILEAAEEAGLPPGIAMCSLNQTRIGAIVKGIIPVPDATLSSSFFCDEEPKVDDYLKEVLGLKHPFWIDNMMDFVGVPFPDDAPGADPEYQEGRIRYLGQELNEALAGVQEVTGVEVTPETFKEAGAATGKMWGGIFGINDLLRSDPMPFSQADFWLARYLITASARRAGTEAPQALSLIVEELKERVAQGKGVVEKGAPRAFIWAMPIPDVSVTKMIERAGIACPSGFLSWFFPIKPFQTKYTTIGDIRAEFEMKVGLYFGSAAWIHWGREGCKFHNVDGFLYLWPFSCRPMASVAAIYKKEIEDKLGIPVLSIESDWWDSRSYTAETLRTRIETFRDLMKARKAAKAR